MDFKFTSARLVNGGFRLTLPPVGAGWFESVFVDSGLRCVRDSRGDLLVVERAGGRWDEAARVAGEPAIL